MDSACRVANLCQKANYIFLRKLFTLGFTFPKLQDIGIKYTRPSFFNVTLLPHLTPHG